ncbi:MAG: hypothetical protein R8K47_01450, partial [Mariprofundaceae bacterium]
GGVRGMQVRCARTTASKPDSREIGRNDRPIRPLIGQKQGNQTTANGNFPPCAEGSEKLERFAEGSVSSLLRLGRSCDWEDIGKRVAAGVSSQPVV